MIDNERSYHWKGRMEFPWDIVSIVEPTEARGQRIVKLVIQLEPDVRIFAWGCGAICWGGSPPYIWIPV